jgi:hypothetical protein
MHPVRQSIHGEKKRKKDSSNRKKKMESSIPARKVLHGK